MSLIRAIKLYALLQLKLAQLCGTHFGANHPLELTSTAKVGVTKRFGSHDVIVLLLYSKIYRGLTLGLTTVDVY